MTTSLVLDFAVHGQRQKGIIYIRDGIALFRCDNQVVAREMYEAERRNNPNVSWDDKLGGMVEKFPHLSKAQIEARLRVELKKMMK